MSEGKKMKFGGQVAPKNKSEIDDSERIIEEARRLIESVTKDNPPNLNRPAATVTSTTHSQSKIVPNNLLSSSEIDREIERLSRFCEGVDRNLNATTMPIENSECANPSSLSQQVVRRANDLLQQVTQVMASYDVSTPTNPVHRRAQVDATPVCYIDLSEAPSPTVTHPINHAIYDDVSNAENVVVDLCTPEVNRRPAGELQRQHRSNQQQQHTPEIVRFRSPIRNARRRSHLVQATRATATDNKRQISGNEVRASLPSSLASGSQNGDGMHAFMCPVCMENMLKNQPTSTSCGHVFCNRCIMQAIRINRKCPMCNKKITPRMIFRIYL